MFLRFTVLLGFLSLSASTFGATEHRDPSDGPTCSTQIAPAVGDLISKGYQGMTITEEKTRFASMYLPPHQSGERYFLVYRAGERDFAAPENVDVKAEGKCKQSDGQIALWYLYKAR